jgi:hypothetical protein
MLRMFGVIACVSLFMLSGVSFTTSLSYLLLNEGGFGAVASMLVSMFVCGLCGGWLNYLVVG